MTPLRAMAWGDCSLDGSPHAAYTRCKGRRIRGMQSARSRRERTPMSRDSHARAKAALAALALAVPTAAGAVTPPESKADDPSTPTTIQRRASVARTLLGALEGMQLGTERKASPFEPPGQPSDRPIESPPGQGDTPNPPGRPEDRPAPPAPGQEKDKG